MTTPDATADAVGRLTRALRESEEREVDHISLNVDESDLRLLLARLTALEADAARYRARFRNYGEHTDACDSWSGVSSDPSGCSCGFNAAWYATFPEDRPLADAAREGVGNG